MALENGGGDPGVAVEDGVNRLGVELLPEPGRVDQISEDHGRRPTRPNRLLLGPGGGLCRRDRVGQLHLEFWVMGQHAALELPERLARLKTKFVREQAAGLSVDVERLGLPSRAVEREHQEGSEPLPEGMLRDECLQLWHDLGFSSATKIGLEPVLKNGQA